MSEERKVGQAAGREGLVGIIWLVFSRYWHLERRREPSQQLVKAHGVQSYVCAAELASFLCRRAWRLEGARQNQGKRANTKFPRDGRGMGDPISEKELIHNS